MQEQQQIPQEQQAKPKLSALIRKGSTMITPKKDHYIQVNAEGKVCGCVIGMAIVAWKPETNPLNLPVARTIDDLIRAAGIVNKEYKTPDGECSDDLEGCIIYLFDVKGWDALKIADWVESQGY